LIRINLKSVVHRLLIKTVVENGAIGFVCVAIRVSVAPSTHPAQKEDLMRKITMTLAAAAFVLATAGLANAQTQGASSLNSQAQNATIIHQAACNGFWGRWCPPGRHRVCGPWRCWCAPCW
jgi:hypothetical protein